MAAVNPRFGEAQALSISYTAVEALSGGALVERRTGARKVGLAGAGSLVVAGVAHQDVVAAATARYDQVKVDEELALNVFRHCVILVTYTAAATVGQKLIAAANGQVTPAGATPDARTVIGECFDATGIGAVGLALIY